MNILNLKHSYFSSPFIATIIIIALLQSSCKQKEASAQLSPLKTQAQLQLDSLAIQLSNDTAIKSAENETIKLYKQDSTYKIPDAQASLKQDIERLAYAAIEETGIKYSAEPQFLWIDHAPREWNGLVVPGSQFGLDNPDNVYRTAYLDSTSQYEIRLHHLEKAPIQESFEWFDGSTGSITTAKHLGFIQVKDLKPESNGDYVLTAGPQAEPSNPNHLQISKPLVNIIYRNTYSNWADQTPASIDIKRVSGKRFPAISRAELVTQSLAAFKTFSIFLLKIKALTTTSPVNTLKKPFSRDGGWGFATAGRFKINKDEAWVITLNPKGAKYLGFELADPWLASLDYIQHSGSLNITQAKPDMHGYYTYVIAATDPGVHNWLDTRGLTEGSLFIRWQAFPNTVKIIDDAIVSQQVVKLANISQAIQGDSFKETPDSRKTILAARAQSYQRRLNP
jgi:hypothetical protein